MIAKILLVDDDRDLLQALRRSLARYADRFLVDVAMDGLEAMEKLQGQDITIVITDMVMPKMEGLGLLAHILERYPETPVIVMTGFGRNYTKTDILTKGSVAYIEKPFLNEDLIQIILAQLSRLAEGGFLHDTSPGMFCQLVAMEEKSCTIRVVDKRTGRHGVLYFDAGQLIEAKTEDERGLNAAWRILGWKEVSMAIQDGCLEKKKVIVESLQSILLEATRRADNISEQERQIDQLRRKLSAALGTDLQDLLVNNSYKPLLQAFKIMEDGLERTGTLKLAYLDFGDKNTVLLPGKDVFALNIKLNSPRDRIIKQIQATGLI